LSLLGVFDSAASKEMLQKAAAFFGQDAGSYIYCVIQPFIGDNIVQALDRTRLGIVATVDEPVYSCQNKRPGTHRARFQRDVHRAAM